MQSDKDQEPIEPVAHSMSETRQDATSISSALSKVRETMSPPTPVSGEIDAIEGRSSMAASGSWFRRLWTTDDDAVVSILPAPGEQDSFGTAHERIEQDAKIQEKKSDLSPESVVSIASNPVNQTPEVREAVLEDSFHADLKDQIRPEQTTHQAMPVSIEEHEPAAKTAKESRNQTVSTFPTTDPGQYRERPRRPLTFHELASRLPALPPVLPAAAPMLVPPPPVAAQPVGETVPESTPQPPALPAPASISAARRAAGQPAANPFERPSLYRPPTTDESFDAAFTTPPEVADQPATGRWDPIPTLRPSGWRDSGSYRAANDASQDEPWDWTSSPNPPQSAGWSDAPLPAPADDSELILTRQWGLLSRFQQSRGLGLTNRRTSAPQDESGTQDAALPTRRKG